MALQAQTDDAGDEAVFELSPFEVSTTEDAGSYHVEDTLAASRLRSDMKDIGAAINILSKDFLVDLGASDVMEVADFVPSVEALKNEQDGPDDNNGVFQPVRFRIRGLFTESVSRNYHVVSAGALPPPDSYNIGRVTFSSGANSILFGAANPAGIVNSSTLQPIFEQRQGKVLFRTDDYGTSRFELDYNLPIVAEKFALRMILLTEDRERFPEPAWYNQDRAYLAGRYNITAKTSISGNFEYFEYARNQPNWAQYINRFGVWEDAGGPLVPWSTTSNPTQPGIRSFTNANLPLFTFGSNGQSDVFTNWRFHPYGDARLVTVRNFGREPASLDLTGARSLVGNMRIDEREGWVSDIAIEHKFNDNLQTQLAFFSSEMDQDLWTSFSNPNAIYLDAAATQEGAPYADSGRYYIRGQQMQRPVSRFETNSFRWTTAYELDLRGVKDFLGRHQFALMFEHREGTRKTDRTSLYDTGPSRPNTSNNQANINRPQAIIYLDQDDTGRIVGSSAPDTRDLAGYYSSFEGVTAEWKSIQAGTWFENRQRSYLGVVQSHFLNDRLVTTLGYRIDEQDAWDLAAADWEKDADGWFLPVRDVSVGPTKAEGISGIEEGTYSIGAVWHVLRGRGALDYMSLSFNKSTNFEPAPSFPTFQGGFRGASTGETQDFGVRFIMLDESLTINVNFFESGQKKARLSGVGFIVDEWNDIWQGLDNQFPGEGFLENLLDEQSKNGDTFDNDAKGIELSMTYNPRPNWRIYISASKNVTELSNIAPSATLYMQENADPIRDAYGDIFLGFDTIAGRIGDMESDLEVVKAQDGSQPLSQPEYKFNLVTNYYFRGALKGIGLGGNVRWQDKGVIGWARDDAGEIEVGKPFYGDSFLNVGLNLSYTRKFKDGKYVWFTQINVNNLLDDTDLIPLRAEEDAALADTAYVYSSNFRQGRSFTLTTSIKF